MSSEFRLHHGSATTEKAAGRACVVWARRWTGPGGGVEVSDDDVAERDRE